MNLNECCLFYEKAEWTELRFDHVSLPEMRCHRLRPRRLPQPELGQLPLRPLRRHETRNFKINERTGCQSHDLFFELLSAVGVRYPGLPRSVRGRFVSFFWRCICRRKTIFPSTNRSPERGRSLAGRMDDIRLVLFF